MSYINKIFFLTSSKRIKLFFISLLFVLASILDLLGIGVIGVYVSYLLKSDEVIKSEFFINIDNYLYLYGFTIDHISIGVFLILIFMIKACVSIFVHSIIIKFTHLQQKNLRVRLLKSYPLIPYIKYIDRNSSEYMATVGGYVKHYGSLLQSILHTSGDIFIAISIFIFLYVLNGPILIILISILVFLTIVYKILFLNSLSIYGEKLNKSYNKMYQITQEYFSGFKELKILNSYDYFEDKIIKATDQIAKSDIRVSIFTLIPRFILESVLVFFVVTIVIFYSIIDNDINKLIPILSVFSAAALRLAPITYTITRLLGDIKFAKNAVDIIYEDLDKDNMVDQEYSSELSYNKEFNSLKLVNVSFKYPTSKKINLKKINIHINKGDAVAIIGKSGSGKTTILDIMLGLLTPNEGAVLFNEVNINDSVKNWRRQVAYLPQDVYLINSSLASNIALGLKPNDIDKDKILSAISQAKLSEFVDELSNGIETIIGERGVTVSGGQKQRIALARAFYFERNFIILDEATSSLDKETESDVINQIKLLKRNKTVILISHNDATIEHCDKVYRLEDGLLTKK